MTSIEYLWDCTNCDTEIEVKIDENGKCSNCNSEYEWDFDCDYDDAVYIPIIKQPKKD